MTDVERMLKIAARFKGVFCTRDVTARTRKQNRVSNTSVAVNRAVERGWLHMLPFRGRNGRLIAGPRRFRVTAKGRKIAAGL